MITSAITAVLLPIAPESSPARSCDSAYRDLARSHNCFAASWRACNSGGPLRRNLVRSAARDAPQGMFVLQWMQLGVPICLFAGGAFTCSPTRRRQQNRPIPKLKKKTTIPPTECALGSLSRVEINAGIAFLLAFGLWIPGGELFAAKPVRADVMRRLPEESSGCAPDDPHSCRKFAGVDVHW